MAKEPMSPIIRRQTSWLSRWIRAIILVALWAFIGLVVVANIGFNLGWYSDTLVSLYLLFNLKAHANTGLLMIIGLLLIVIPLYCGWRLYRLRKEAAR